MASSPAPLLLGSYHHILKQWQRFVPTLHALRVSKPSWTIWMLVRCMNTLSFRSKLPGWHDSLLRRSSNSVRGLGQWGLHRILWYIARIRSCVIMMIYYLTLVIIKCIVLTVIQHPMKLSRIYLAYWCTSTSLEPYVIRAAPRTWSPHMRGCSTSLAWRLTGWRGKPCAMSPTRWRTKRLALHFWALLTKQ